VYAGFVKTGKKTGEMHPQYENVSACKLKMFDGLQSNAGYIQHNME
jgi:hypothetical protein